jgi:hypothetical protein
MKDENLRDSLKISLKYKEVEANFEGNYSEVWKFLNEFLKGIKQTLGPKEKNAIIISKDRSVPEILLELRDSCFFDNSKTSQECFNRLKELGKPKIKSDAVQMALQRLVQKGELARRVNIDKPGTFVYTSPYIE